MIRQNKPVKMKYHGTVLILAMILIIICSAFAVSIAGMSNTNIQLASNQHRINSALSAAQSGIECCKFLINTLKLPSTNRNVVSRKEADKAWNLFCLQLRVTAFDGRHVPLPSRFNDKFGGGDQIITEPLNYDSDNINFTLRFFRYDNDPNTIKIQSAGTCGKTVQYVNMDMRITKENKILHYAVAGRGRLWITGKSIIHGDIFSAWNRPEISPFKMADNSVVDGTINTVLRLDQIKKQNYQLETLNENNEPMNKNRQTLVNNYESRYYSYEDEIKAYHEGVNYSQANSKMPGLNISDYNTDMYNSDLTDIPPCQSSKREVEYFPHAAGKYNYPKEGAPYNTPDRKLTRHVYKNQTFINARLPSNRNALFRNCTFEGILYIDCNKNAKYYFNNVRFENCTFKGAVITNVPESFEWRNNCLYFTGESIFENTSSIREATILAPNFNVNLGNTNTEQSENNILSGAIIGGVVDIRGNAKICGTIISMCDTTQWSLGYVTNIGATLDDGGSETAELSETGIISITPDRNQMLPGGIKTPIIIKPLKETYSEILSHT